MLKNYKLPIMMFLIFEVIAVSLWLTTERSFYFFNFTYIGSVIALGLILHVRGYQHSRLAIQLGVGLYMFVFLGVISRENMNLEGFWYYLFLGVFQAAVIHYAIAKLFGPLFFGRGWCGYACWTPMLLDLLPYQIPNDPRRKELHFLRWIVFAISLLYVILLFTLEVPAAAEIMFWSFLIVNALYYLAGAFLAAACKDNRAFCKYLCPITVFLKPASYFSILRVKADQDLCISCNQCRRECPMDVDMLDNRRSRENGTECILCLRCVQGCPTGALKL